MSEGVPFYHSSVVEKLLAVGLHNRSRTLPEMTRFGGAPVGPMVAGTANPKSRNRILDTTPNPATEYWIPCLKKIVGGSADLNAFGGSLNTLKSRSGPQIRPGQPASYTAVLYDRAARSWEHRVGRFVLPGPDLA